MTLEDFVRDTNRESLSLLEMTIKQAGTVLRDIGDRYFPWVRYKTKQNLAPAAQSLSILSLSILSLSFFVASNSVDNITLVKYVAG